VQALVVSDGHGGAKYDRSDLGSQIACRVALAEVQQRLSRARLNQGDNDEAWRQWLLESLPEQIVERWCQDVLDHGRAHPRDDGAPPSTLAYGATLGLLLLTPRWWGYSGLGDWDLVRINADGSAELISEEPDNPGGGEATFSLCMEGAAHHFAPRSGLVPINAGQAPFSLLLSSDGIRKSCGTDADYLTLAHYLCELSSSPGDLETSELGQALDHISAQGSGDDVSVAIGRWGQLQDHRRGTHLEPSKEPRIVQPSTELPAQAAETGDPFPGAPGSQDPGSADRGTNPGAPTANRAATGNPWPLGLLLAGGTVMLALVGLAAISLMPWGPWSQRPGDPQSPHQKLLAVVQTKASELCTPGPEHRERIDSTLIQRKSLFPELLKSPQSRQRFLTEPDPDPLGTLIAWSYLQPRLNPAAPSPGSPDPSTELPGATELKLCAPLEASLRMQWDRTRNAAEEPSSQR
jgi:hypothetical protein